MCKGYDLRDWNYESGDSLRRLWVFYNGLPFKNEVNRVILKLSPVEWDQMWSSSEGLLADIYDSIQQNTYTLIKVNVDKGTAVQEPKPYPRPDYDKEPKPKKRLRDLFSDVQM